MVQTLSNFIQDEGTTDSTEDAEEPEPDIIKWQQGPIIGHGGFGTVYIGMLVATGLSSAV